MKTKLRGFASGLLLISTFATAAASADGQRMLAIDLEGDTTIERAPVKDKERTCGERIVLHQQDRNITTACDVGTPYSLYITRNAYKGQFAIGLGVDREHRPNSVSEKSKFEINVSRHDDLLLDRRFSGHYILRAGSARFLGFAFYMDPSYEQPIRWLLHMQVWQCCSNDTQPPFAFQVLPNATLGSGSIRFVAIKRTDAHLGNPPTSDNGERLVFQDGKDFIDLVKGRWYRFVFALQPNPQASDDSSTTGRLSLWIDGQLALQHIGAWSYTPRPQANVQSTFAVKVGIYRAAQATSQQIAMDVIRWGTSAAAVDPDLP